MTDIVERLLAFRPPYGWPEEWGAAQETPLNEQAAAEIRRLREIVRLAIAMRDAQVAEAYVDIEFDFEKLNPLMDAAFDAEEAFDKATEGVSDD